jgi:cytochrome oxidase Cu insertion factor (SCO1/SenC/PrrC family)
MKHAALFFWLAVLLVASAGYGWRLASRHDGADSAADSSDIDWATVKVDKEIPAGDSTPTPDFALTERSGREFHSRSLRGSVWVGSFFFCSCPGPCLRLNQTLASLQEEPALDGVRFVSITCDPQNDTPEALQGYANKFNADSKRWLFLTGDLKSIIALGQEHFMVFTAPQTHTDVAIVLDRQSRIRGLYHTSDEADVRSMRRLLRKLLAEPAADQKKPAIATR